MTFYSPLCLSSFRLVQSVYLQSALIEQWQFSFGFVIPQSTNAWQCVIGRSADGPARDPLPVHLLSGNVLIETTFYDADALLATARLRVYYDGAEP